MYPTDFLAGVGHLGNTELGIYWRLLLVYYRDQRPLPYDTDKLRRIAMTFSPEEYKSLTEVLSEFFVAGSLSDGTRVWRHSRADREISRANESRDAQIKRTEAARNARWRNGVSVTESVTESVTPCSQTENQNHNQKKEKRGAVAPVVLPDWLPEAAWQDWCDHRKSIRKAMTPKARQLNIARLAELRDEGHDPGRVIENAIASNWTGLYPLKADQKGGAVIVAHPSAATPDEAILRRISEQNGGMSVTRLRDGRLQCGIRYYRPNGVEEMAI
jgi:uncharacterized protein YdaU (DUF1376 family)